MGLQGGQRRSGSSTPPQATDGGIPFNAITNDPFSALATSHPLLLMLLYSPLLPPLPQPPAWKPLQPPTSVCPSLSMTPIPPCWICFFPPSFLSSPSPALSFQERSQADWRGAFLRGSRCRGGGDWKIGLRDSGKLRGYRGRRDYRGWDLGRGGKEEGGKRREECCQFCRYIYILFHQKGLLLYIYFVFIQ